jgi:SRSO17 transposase
MSSLLEHPRAQELLADAEVSTGDLARCTAHLEAFLRQYFPRFYRVEQHDLARVVLTGKLSKLQRKTSEPIAVLANRHRKPIQHFVGAGAWDDEAVMKELRAHVAQQRPDPDAVLAIDPSGFAKSGTDSCGVSRQWCGRLGKVENGQVGVFAAYVTTAGAVLVDRRLYLPEDWAADSARRQRTHVPGPVTFQESWRIGLDLVARCGEDLRFAWVTGDDELGRCSEFRAGLRFARRRYVLDVPCNTHIRDLSEPVPEGRRRQPWRRVDEWAALQPASRWQRIELPAGSKGPRAVRAIQTWAQTKDEGGHPGPRERVLVIRTIGDSPDVGYALSNAPVVVGLGDCVRAQRRRHGIEEALELGKGEVGLGHYEVRSWVGWHHHVTLTLLAAWFLALEGDGLKKSGFDDGAAGS